MQDDTYSGNETLIGVIDDHITYYCEATHMKHLLCILIFSLAILMVSCSRNPGSHQDHGDSTAAGQSSDYYTCSMHPQVHLDKPGVCPICGMDLVKASNSRKTDVSAPTSEALVPLNERDQVLANVATTTVGYEEVEHTVRAYGNLAIAEPKKAIISARFNGRIEKLYVDAVGKRVQLGDPLFDLYSPDIVQAANEYIQATRSTGLGQTNVTLLRSKLELLGLTGRQIKDLEISGVAPLVITYHSPASGTVVDKKIVTGVYVSEGVTLYELADLTTLWNIAELYESDAGLIAVGEKAILSTSALPNKTFPGTVSLVYPVVDPLARTIKVRLTVNNAADKLRPNMYTETVFRQKVGRAITVPVSAVLITGKRNLVYVKMDHENHFQAREVGLGTRFDGKYEITFGLKAGEEIVTEGGYLIDSESQLKSGSGAAHQHGGTLVPPEKQAESDSMTGMKMQDHKSSTHSPVH